MAGMRFPIRLGVLAVAFAACSFVAAQTPSERVGAHHLGAAGGAIRQGPAIVATRIAAKPQECAIVDLAWHCLFRQGRQKGIARCVSATRWRIRRTICQRLEGAAQIEYDGGGKDAAALLQHILQLSPNDPTSHAMLAVLDYRRGDCAARGASL